MQVYDTGSCKDQEVEIWALFGKCFWKQFWKIAFENKFWKLFFDVYRTKLGIYMAKLSKQKLQSDPRGHIFTKLN